MKKRMKLMTAVLAGIVVAGTLFSSCSSKDPSKAPSAQQAQKKKIWTCPMHPQIKKDGPGSCPICGMSLVKASAADEEVGAADSEATHSSSLPEGHAPFKLSMARQQMIGVRLGVVEKKPLFKSIEAAGRVAFDPELYTAQNEYLEAIKQQERVQNSPIAEVKHSARRMVESAKLRLKILGLSDKQIVAIGESGSSGANLLIPKLGETLWVYAEVFEQDLHSVQPGLEAVITGGSLAGGEVIGKVVSVDRVINPTTRTAKVRISVPNAKMVLRPESYVDVAIRSPLGQQVAVPFDAVLDTGKQAWVFVVKEGGTTFEPRLVTISQRADDEVAISSGVRPGEKIVTSANFLIDSESRLKGVLVSQQTGAETVSGAKPATPECPKGQVWHAEMKHCMTKVGE